MLNLGSSGRYKQYDVVSNMEKRRAEKDFVRLKEYEHFYLYGKVDKDNNVLYKECFNKIDIDGPQIVRRPSQPIFTRKDRFKNL